ncbi:hypothetical protein MASR1M31_03420 [Porphyromonadaceae bacterium]
MKTICNSASFILSLEVESISEGVPIPKTGKNFVSVDLFEKPVYSSEIKQSTSGPIREERISCIVNNKLPDYLDKNMAFGFISKLKSENSTFFVGMTNPLRMTESSDLIGRHRIVFSCRTPVK